MQNELEVKIPFLGKNYIFYVYSAFLGMFGGLGFYCLMSFIFSSPSRHPISHPSYALLGILALIVCFIFFGLYWSYYNYMKKKLQTVLHFLTIIAGFVIGLPFSGFMDKVVRSILEPLIK